MTRSEYDRGINTFSPEGRLFQVEYAIEAIKLGSTAIGIKTNEGVVLAVEKRINSVLLEPRSVQKIWKIDNHIGCAVSGLVADSRTLMERARTDALEHWFMYNQPMTVESTAQAVSKLAIGYGKTLSRPFGVALLFAGCDHRGPNLVCMDPSGTYVAYNAKAIGSASEGAQQTLQDVYYKDMTLNEALKQAVSILKQVMEEKINNQNVEVATVTPEKLYHVLLPEEVQKVLEALE